MKEWTTAEVLDAVASAVPERLMTICGERRSTFAESADRVRRLANFLAARGHGVHVERDRLERWEVGQDRVALIMHNDLYVDAYLGCLAGRVVPFNVNHFYARQEIGDLLAAIEPSAVIYHRSLAHLIADGVLPASASTRIVIDDGPGPQIPGELEFSDALASVGTEPAITASPDDLLMVCTGGTTGRPKGVLWRQADAYISGMTGMEHERVEDLLALVPDTPEPFFAVSPLMHAAGVLTALSAIMAGRTAVIYDNRNRFDARTVLRTAEAENARIVTIVGDAHAAPIIEELAENEYHLDQLIGIGSGGAGITPKNKDRLLELLPHIVVLDTFGSSETGGMATSPNLKDAPADTFTMHPSGRVVSEDRTRFLEPGEPELGWIARCGRVPLGYFNDRAATLATFPEIDGQRVAVPGDRARIEADGTIRLHGRDSLMINTGGEKVFVEEVEEVLRSAPDVLDALVVGRPDDRWGNEVVALVSLSSDVVADIDRACAELRDFASASLARFKVPREIIVVDKVHRLANGKADYRWAKARVLDPGAEPSDRTDPAPATQASVGTP